MTEERNFRSCYYDKCGFRAVEEKKSIEILLKEQPMDVEKLSQFCLRFPVPTKYRHYVWKILLGVLPSHQPSHTYVSQQHRAMYQDGLHCLTVLRRVNEDTPTEEVFLKLYLLEEGNLPFEEKNLYSDPAYVAFMLMAGAVSNVADADIDRYWITSRFYRYFLKFSENLPLMPEKTVLCLKKEDVDKKLLLHLQENNVLSSLPLMDWFRCCFAGVLPDISFERVWDKVLGGSPSILVFVAVAIFLTFRRPLLSMNTTDEMVAYLRKIPEDCGDKLVSDAVELWQKHGFHMMQPKSDSPVHDKTGT
ncbi:TBC1 domain family member 7-like [Haliotis rubra]|uniref:TBC1 domain family member 7-like n=1 Tax=Haliotis rubra TaxID=36100 RepID=UPI001EE62E45|nr:TBC1 domain family member 7-like [Haliotis rubra]